MRLVITAIFLLMIALAAGNTLAQDEVIAQAYRTVNVRSGPGTQYDIIGQLTSGSEVEITGRSSEDNDWLRIDFDGKEGWVAYFTVTVLGDTDDLPVVEPLSDRSLPPRVTATPTAIHAAGDVYVMAYRRVNVRSGPGIEYATAGNLEVGSTADVTGRSADSEWLQIDFAGIDGWVAYFVVSLNGSLDDVPVVEAPPITVEVVTRYNVNLHEAPILGTDPIAIVPFDTPLAADARSDEVGSWLRVTYDGQIGWVNSALVSVNGDLDNLPIEAAEEEP